MDMDALSTGVPLSLFQPLLILPEQHFDPPHKLAPEYRLMIAVLDDAVWCLEKYRLPRDARGRRLFHRAKRWLLAREPHWPYSFESICAVLDLDANAVRYRLGLMPGPPPVAAVREVPPASRRKPKTCKHLQLKRNGTNGRFERMEEERP